MTNKISKEKLADKYSILMFEKWKKDKTADIKDYFKDIFISGYEEGEKNE